MKKTHLLSGLLALCSLASPLTRAQSPVAAGAGSYASAIPAAENVTTENNTRYVLPGVAGAYPTNEWWTPLMTTNLLGNGGSGYHLWAMPASFTVQPYGIGMHLSTQWVGDADHQLMASPDPLQARAAGFTPTGSQLVKSWSDWTVAFRLQESTTRYMDVTLGHGMPYAWIEYTGIASPQIATTNAPAAYFTSNGAVQTFPFTGDHVGIEWDGRYYGVFAPAGTQFSLSGSTITVTYASGARTFLVVAAMPSKAALPSFYANAYSIPRNTMVTPTYEEANGLVHTDWTITTEALKTGASGNIIQGWIPHHYKNTATNVVFNGMEYATPRGKLKCAVGNTFRFTYKFQGVLAQLPVPEAVGGSNPYNPATLNQYISDYANTAGFGADTYGGGKDMTMAAQQLTYASLLNNTTAANTLKTKLRAELENWFTYTPGEANKYYARMPNWGALLGEDHGFGSEQFNDHHFHYGYHVYAAAILGIYDEDFLAKYAPMAKLVAKEFANWDRTDNSFPVFRTLDPWEGHSWANGGYGYNPPFGGDQESTSEAMMSWSGVFLLGSVTGDNAMRAAGAMGYVMESAAANEYWFNRDNDNFPAAWGPAGKIACILHGSQIEYQSFFGLNPAYLHGIQYIPVLPSSYYLVRNFTASNTEFEYMRTRSVQTGYGDLGNFSPNPVDKLWDNLAIRYLSMFDAERAAAQPAQGTSAAELALTYYQVHSNRSLGRFAWDHYIGAAHSGVFYNSTLNRYTYMAYNPTSTAKTYNVYQHGALKGSFTVPAHSFYSTHTLGTSGNQAPAVAITTPQPGTSYTPPASINIAATATDADGSITQVAFYQGNTLLGVDSSSPYTFNWTNVAAGTYSITARATDNGGLTTVSAAVGVTVTATPVSDNLALNKPVTASSTEMADYPASAAVDGNATTTRWSSAFSDPQWLQVDLGASYNISEVKITWEAAYAANYLVQVSANGTTWQDVKTITGNTALVNDHTRLGATGRYVRMYGTVRGTAFGYSIYELEVYGTPGNNGNTACTGTAVNGDYSYEVSTGSSNSVTWKFIPQSAIAGSTLAILYVKSGSATTYTGYTMNAAGSNFTYSLTQPAGTAVSFYFTYRVGNTPVERNSSANPHSYVTGTACAARVAALSAVVAAPQTVAAGNAVVIYPNPVSQVLSISTALPVQAIHILNAAGKEVKTVYGKVNQVNVTGLVPGIYWIKVLSNHKTTVLSFVKK